MNTKIFISIFLIAALFVPWSTVNAAPRVYELHIRVPASAAWINTGHTVTAGQAFTITGYGQVLTISLYDYRKGSGRHSISGPDGQGSICPNFQDAPPCAMENAPYGALVGKIGSEGTPFLIGSHLEFTPITFGELYLAVNDLLLYHADNSGYFMVFY